MQQERFLVKKNMATDFFPAEAIDKVARQLLDDKRESMAALLRVDRTTIYRNASKGHRHMTLAFYQKACKKLGFLPTTGLPLGEGEPIPPQLISFPILGRVAAGIPAAPQDAVILGDALETLQIPPETWRILFPGVNPAGLVALRIDGTSMAPRHGDGDLIFVLKTRDKTRVRDGQAVVVDLPGTGSSFKIWRKTDILEGFNPAFVPIRCPQGARLWGVYVCGTRNDG
jgi:SOS-response transcriptional repressor LexA